MKYKTYVLKQHFFSETENGFYRLLKSNIQQLKDGKFFESPERAIVFSGMLQKEKT